MPSHEDSNIESIAADSQAPASIVKYGYGALFLFSITSTVASWSSGRLSSFIIVAVVVVGFLLALLAFDSMVRSRSRFWRFVGAFFSTTALLGILIVFLSVLSFLITGFPPGLETIFPQEDVEPVAGLAAERTDSQSVMLTWSSYDDAKATVRILPLSIEASGRERPPTEAKAVDGRATITGLEAGTRYRFRVEVHSGYREPAVAEIVASTDAINRRFQREFYDFYYTGKLSPDGTPNDSRAVVTFEEMIPGVRWQFEGPVKDGALHGKGLLRPSAHLCDGPVCGSYCDVEMSHGALKDGRCDLNLLEGAVAAVTSQDSQSLGMFFDGTSTYSGRLKGLSPKENRPHGAVWLGPFSAVYEGEGIFENEASSARIEGGWINGALSGAATIKIGSARSLRAWGEYERGRLRNGYQLTVGSGLGPYTYEGHEYVDFLPRGASISFHETFAEFGRSDGHGHIVDGYGVGASWNGNTPEFGGTAYHADGSRQRLTPTSDKRRNECVFEEDIGLFPERRAWQYADQWALQCGRSASGNATSVVCDINSRPDSIFVRATRSPGAPPDLNIALGINPGRNAALKIDDSVFDSGGKGWGLNEMAPIAIAKLCTGSTATNLGDRSSFSTTGFCRLAAVMFSRLYNCI